MSHKKVVGCRGRSQNVEGCWWFPYLKREKLASSHFMFFDRSEIHIQAFVYLINAIDIIFRSSSSEVYISNEYSFFTNKNETNKTVRRPSKHFAFLMSIFSKIICFQDVPIFFLYSLKHFGH